MLDRRWLTAAVISSLSLLLVIAFVGIGPSPTPSALLGRAQIIASGLAPSPQPAHQSIRADVTDALAGPPIAAPERAARPAPVLHRTKPAAKIRRARHHAEIRQVRRHRHVSAARHGRRTAAWRRARRAAHLAYLHATFRFPRTHPGHIVRGHYIRSLVGRPPDSWRMYWLGARDAARNPRGLAHLVLLDIGGQVRGGVRLSIVNRFIRYPALVRAMAGYVAGYHAAQRRNAPATIAIGTNNDLYTSANAGRVWARRVINPVRASARRYGAITIAGADDIEPGFRARPWATRGWLHGYLHNTRAPFVFNGSADGCSPRHTRSRCNHGWNARTLAVLAGAAAPRRILTVPQIYNPTMAAQWAQIARTARQLFGRTLRILGPLTEQRACGRNPACPSMPNPRAWWVLRRQLHRTFRHLRSLPVQVDLDVR